MNYPLISVLLPVYNHEQYIQQAINSIINQTYKNIELLIINDGSTDNTIKKINELKNICKKRFPSFIFKTQKNKRICYTENKLLSLANGKYCFFIDADDIAKPNAILDLYKYLSKHNNYALAVGDNEFIDENSKIFYLTKHRKKTYNLKSACYKTRAQSLSRIRTDLNFNSSKFGTYSSIIRENYILNGFLIKTEALRQIGGFNLKASIWDTYLMLQLSKYFKFKFINKVLYSYRCHELNDTITNKKLLTDSFIDTFNYELNLIKALDLSKINANARKCIKNKSAEFILKSRLLNLINYKTKLLKNNLI